MKIKSKTSFLLKIALCVALALSTFCVVMGFVGNNKLVAKAETVDVTETVQIVDAGAAGWGHGSDELIFIVRMTPHTSVTGVWNFSYSDYQTANNGVDILEYIYVNNESARTAVNNNQNGVTSHAGASGWLANGGSCAPVFAETNGEGIVVRIDTDYSTTCFNFTLKAGLSLLNASGNIEKITEDIVFNYNNGVITKVPPSVDVTETVSIVDAVAAGWGHGSDELIFIVRMTPHT
ncbi:MAG: hypothetical protein IKA99_08415, partial [Clostridia bacterium]|nr:hypothetical protein [Clostridia bacterium]